MRFWLVSGAETLELRTDGLWPLSAAKLRGGSGWGAAPRVNRWFETASEGALFRGARVTQRTYVLPAACFGEGEALRQVVRRLVRMTHGEMTLRAMTDEGAVFTLAVIYESGLEGADLAVTGRGVAFEGLTLKGAPYWVSESTQQVEWRDATQFDFLGSLTLSASSLSGVRAVTNAGDVVTRPSWRVDGPASSVEVSVEGGGGFHYAEPIDEGEALLVEWTGWGWSVRDLSGENQYPGMVGVPVFPVLPPGTSQVALSVAGTGPATRVAAWWPERREVVF